MRVWASIGERASRWRAHDHPNARACDAGEGYAAGEAWIKGLAMAKGLSAKRGSLQVAATPTVQRAP